MKSYKEFEQIDLGFSDISTLICVGCSLEHGGLSLKQLNFGSDGSYSAYFIKGDAEIGKHYEKQLEFKNWLKIYDDEGMVLKVYADKILIYTAGDFGCIIQYFE